ncbi:hypothetical protein FIC_02196 [Flavobacteriaceae bacterium 3519-10]|nr:hypothetical protein FIC_02196 [Flavobacteriaceae bacterium 3519-10]
MRLLRTIFSFFFIFGTIAAYSQSGKVSIETDSAMVAANGEMRSLMVRIENNTAISQDLHLVSKADDGIRILNAKAVVKINPGEKLFVPFKIFIEKRQPAGSSVISLQLQDASEKTVATWETLLTVEPKRLLRISANEPQVLIYRVGDSLKISTQVTNGGNQTEQAEIFATFPQYLGSETVLKKKVTLQPFTSQKVEFSRIVDRDLLRMEIFTVNVAGTNSNKEFFGNAMVMVQNALGNRRYIDPQLHNTYRRASENHISWTTSNPFEQYSASHNIDLRSEVSVGDTNAIFNINGTYWPTLDTKMLFQNTWLKLEHKQFGLQVGNLNSSDLEINLNGRGAQLSYTPDAAGKTMITTGAVEKSYNIFDPIRLNNFPRGYSAFAKSVHSLGENEKLDGEVVLDTDPFQKSFILKSGYEFNNRKDTSYDIDAGYGYTRSSRDAGDTKSSVSLGFNYRKSWDKYAFSSSNYYSSGYYPGIKRGSTVSEHRISRTFEKFSLYGGYSLNIYNPKNIEPLYQFNSLTERHRAEAGSNFTLGKRISVNMVSQLSGEESDVFLGDAYAQVPVKFNSATLSAALNYSTTDNRNRFTLAHAQGFSQYEGRIEAQHIYSFQANWHRGNFMLSANYQHGNFLLYEGSRNGVLTSDSEKFSAIANYRLSLLNNRFNLNLTTLANLDSQTGNSVSLSSHFDYRLLRTTKIFGSYNYNRYSRGGFDTGNSYYQFGISQDLPRIGDESVKYRNGMIKVFTFYDLNNNNLYDAETDKPARGAKVKINNTIFIADEDGNIRYRKVPYGEYIVKPAETDWYGDTTKADLQQKEILIILALEKTGVMRGTVEYEKTSRIQYEVQERLAGIPVLFRNSLGKTFTFYTNDQGAYNAYLPLGSYEVFLDSQVLQRNVYVEHNLQAAVAEESGVTVIDKFLLKVREKKVEIKRFGIAE